MKAKYVSEKRATLEPAKIPPAKGDLISKTVAIEWISSEVVEPDDSMRQTKDKVRQRIKTAINNGVLTEHPGRKVVFGEIVHWAIEKWPDAVDLKSLPRAPLRVNVVATLDASMWLKPYMVPGDLDACQAALLAALRRIDDLGVEIDKMKAEMAVMRQKEASRDKKAEKGREAKQKQMRKAAS